MKRQSVVLVLVWITIMKIGDGADLRFPCDFQACFPKLTTNSSKLNTLLVFGIFEVTLQEKCLSFAEADACIRQTQSTCHGPITLKRKFHMDSWHNAKKLFDYVCLDEYTAFREHQTCLRDLALSNELYMCDSYFSSKTTASDVCNLPSKVSKCVEIETSKTCPDIVVSKVVKMVDMFLHNMININQSACQQTTTNEMQVKVHSEDQKGREVELNEVKQLIISQAISVGGVKGLQTDPPTHNFIVTRRRPSRPTPRHRTDDVDDEDGDDNDFDIRRLPSTGHHGDRWYQQRDKKDDDYDVSDHDGNLRDHIVNVIHHRIQHGDDNDANEKDFSRRHSPKHDQYQHSRSSAIITSPHIIILSSFNFFITIRHVW